jgi:hypothetical protein
LRLQLDDEKTELLTELTEIRHQLEDDADTERESIRSKTKRSSRRAALPSLPTSNWICSTAALIPLNRSLFGSAFVGKPSQARGPLVLEPLQMVWKEWSPLLRSVCSGIVKAPSHGTHLSAMKPTRPRISLPGNIDEMEIKTEGHVRVLVRTGSSSGTG